MASLLIKFIKSRLFLFSLSLFFLASCSPDNFESTLYQAQSLRSQKKYEQALSKYSILIKKFPHHNDINKVLLETADLYDTIFQNSIMALKYYNQVSQQQKDPFSLRTAYEKMGEVYQKNGDWVMAIDSYQKRLKYFPEDKGREEILFAIADSHWNLKDYKQAEFVLNKWIHQFPGHVLSDKVYMRLGEIYFAEQRFKEAYSTFEKVTQDYPKSSLKFEAYYNRAFCLEEMGDWNQALEQYKKIKDTYPNKDAIETKIKHMSERIKKSHRG